MLSLAELEKRGAAYLEKHPDADQGAGRRDHRGPARHPHLHLRHHRPPQGRAAAARQLVVHGQGDRRDRPDQQGRRAVPVAAARARLRQGAHLRARSRSGTSPPSTAGSTRSSRICRSCSRRTWRPCRASSRRSTTGSRPRRGRAAAPSTRSSSGRPRSPASTPRPRRTTSAAPARPPSPFGLSAKHKVADALVYAKLREAFGGRLRACVSGSAALAPEIGYFFAGAGIHILEGYGLTESSAASFVNPGEAYRTGTVGKPLPGTEVRIADDGEILLRGPGIMEGYHGLPEKTAEVLESDGWFHTGDIGELSAGRLPADHRPQEGPDQDVRRQVHRAGRGRGPVQGGVPVRLQHPGARRRPELLHGADRARRAVDPRLGQGERPGRASRTRRSSPRRRRSRADRGLREASSTRGCSAGRRSRSSGCCRATSTSSTAS